MGCVESSSEVEMEENSAEKKKNADKQLGILTGSLLSALYTHHAATKWYETVKNKGPQPASASDKNGKWGHGSKKAPMERTRTALIEELEDDVFHCVTSQDYHKVMDYLSKRMASTQVDLVVGSLLSALYTFHAAHKWKENVQKQKTVSQDADAEPDVQPEAGDKPILFRPDPPALILNESESLCEHHDPKTNEHEKCTCSAEEIVEMRKRIATQQLNMVTETVLSALYTYHAASEWDDHAKSAPFKRYIKIINGDQESIDDVFKSITEKDYDKVIDYLNKKKATTQLDIFADSLLSALYTYRAANKWRGRITKTPEPEPVLPTTKTQNREKPKGGKVEKAKTGRDKILQKGVQSGAPQEDSIDMTTEALLSALFTYRAATKWHGRICQATVELLKELGFDEDEGQEDENNKCDIKNFHALDTKFNASSVDQINAAIERLISELNAQCDKDEKEFERLKSESAKSSTVNLRNDDVDEDLQALQKELENDEFLEITNVTEFVNEEADN